MHIEKHSIHDLHPAPYNPRVTLRPGDAAYDRLRRSLREFGLVQPIVWNRRTGHVVGGHQRLEILRSEGRTEVECVVVDLPLEREKALNVALNVALNNDEVAGRWEPDRLHELLEDLLDVPDFDATLTGFDEQQLRDMLLAPDPHAELDEPAPDATGRRLDEGADEFGGVTATLEIPCPRWLAVRAHLDDLLAEEPAVALHVRMPQREDE